MKDLIEKLFGLKAIIDELNRELGNHKEAYDQLCAEVLQGLDENGLDKASLTGFGTVSRKEEVVPSVKDWDSFYKYIAENEAWYLMQRRPAANACREQWATGEEIPGVEPFTQFKLSVTKAR